MASDLNLTRLDLVFHAKVRLFGSDGLAAYKEQTDTQASFTFNMKIVIKIYRIDFGQCQVDPKLIAIDISNTFNVDAHSFDQSYVSDRAESVRSLICWLLETSNRRCHFKFSKMLSYSNSQHQVFLVTARDCSKLAYRELKVFPCSSEILYLNGFF